MLALLVFAFASTSSAQQSIDWLTGAQLNRQARETAISLDWQNAPLRQRLSELTARQRISVFLDRRIDGSQEIRFSAVNVTFEELLWRLCEQIGAGLCRVDEVYYIGPRESAALLPYEVAQLKQVVSKGKSSASIQRRWQRASSITLAQLTEPKLTLEGFCRGVSCQVENLDVVPYDLWAETRIGNCSLVGRVALMLSGFGKSFRLSEDLSSLSIIERGEIDRLRQEWSVGEDVRKVHRQLAEAFPELGIAREKRSVVVSGTPEQVLTVHRKLVSLQSPEVAELSSQKFTIKTADKRGTIMASIANQIARKLKYESEHVEQLNMRIELEMKDASVEALIQATLEGSGLGFRITEEALEVITK